MSKISCLVLLWSYSKNFGKVFHEMKLFFLTMPFSFIPCCFFFRNLFSLDDSFLRVSMILFRFLNRQQQVFHSQSPHLLFSFNTPIYFSGYFCYPSVYLRSCTTQHVLIYTSIRRVLKNDYVLYLFTNA